MHIVNHLSCHVTRRHHWWTIGPNSTFLLDSIFTRTRLPRITRRFLLHPPPLYFYFFFSVLFFPYFVQRTFPLLIWLPSCLSHPRNTPELRQSILSHLEVISTLTHVYSFSGLCLLYLLFQYFDPSRPPPLYWLIKFTFPSN